MKKSYLKIRVIICDDHEMAREGLKIMLRKIDSVELVAEAESGDELIRLTRKLKPDVLIIDVKMPRMNGIETTKLIKKEFPHIGIVGLSSFDEEHLVLDMLGAGATGYLLKNTGSEELLTAILAAYKEEVYYSKEIGVKLAQMIARGGLFNKVRKPENDFSEREVEIIKLVCKGLSSKQIAEKIRIGTRTVESYRNNIMSKMEVANVAEFVVFAIRYGFFKPGEE